MKISFLKKQRTPPIKRRNTTENQPVGYGLKSPSNLLSKTFGFPASNCYMEKQVKCKLTFCVLHGGLALV